MAEGDSKGAAYAIVPDDQKLTLRLSPAPGSLLRAATVGGTIRAMGRLLRACSDDGGDHGETFVTGLTMDDGVVTIEFSVLPRADTPALKEEG